MSDPSGTEPCCDGIEVINKKLEEFNAVLNTNLFGFPRTTLATTKLREKVRAKKKAPLVFASFCPFCGKSYPGTKDATP